MKNLIIYYSFSRNNDLLAKHLQVLLNCTIVEITEHKKRTGLTIFLDLLFKRNPQIEPVLLPVSQYDHLIFIAPIWAGRIATPLSSYLKRLNGNLKSYSFISLCGGSNNRKVFGELVRLTGKNPLKVLEITVNDLLPSGSSIKATSSYRVKEDDLLRVHNILTNFISDIGSAGAPEKILQKAQ